MQRWLECMQEKLSEAKRPAKGVESLGSSRSAGGRGWVDGFLDVTKNAV